VLPWDDHRAAVSLTFDDARPVQLDVAIPELNKRHLRGSFFVTVSKLTRLDEWRRAQAEGHEIGNHTVTHEHPASLSKEGEEVQVEDAKNFLDSNFNANIITFAYPYMELSPGVLFWVKKYNFAARGWPQDPNLLYVRADADPDWYNLPSQPVFTKYDIDVYHGWVEKAVSLGAWTTFQFHGIGDPSTGWEPISTDTFISLLDYLKAEQGKGLWIAPFGEVAAYLQAQRTLESVKPEITKNEQRFAWDIPTPFPTGVVLKITLAGGHALHIYQNGHQLQADKKGAYSVAFDARDLVVRGAL
jgi:peptidoglycan/xylan/chitin deacetylase (PgdA/CDA1 family)